ncbi:hypothetical protein [Bosea massiliensis]|uniref:Uncharacterized protein n=1 Tax=Bosea massiliensis TaxID=151419 RepID=A0ABW0PD18_9HYPH
MPDLDDGVLLGREERQDSLVSTDDTFLQPPHRGRDRRLERLTVKSADRVQDSLLLLDRSPLNPIGLRQTPKKLSPKVAMRRERIGRGEESFQCALGFPAHECGSVVAPPKVALVPRGLERHDQIDTLAVRELGGVTLWHGPDMHATCQQIVDRQLGLVVSRPLRHLADKLSRFG